MISSSSSSSSTFAPLSAIDKAIAAALQSSTHYFRYITLPGEALPNVIVLWDQSNHWVLPEVPQSATRASAFRMATSEMKRCAAGHSAQWKNDPRRNTSGEDGWDGIKCATCGFEFQVSRKTRQLVGCAAGVIG